MNNIREYCDRAKYITCQGQLHRLEYADSRRFSTMRLFIHERNAFRVCVSVALILAASLALMPPQVLSARVLLDSAFTYTTTYTTTMEVTFNYLTTVNGKTYFAGYINTTTAIVTAVVVSSSTGPLNTTEVSTTIRPTSSTTMSSTTQLPSRPIPAFSVESIVMGLLLGALLLAVSKKSRNSVRCQGGPELK